MEHYASLVGIVLAVGNLVVLIVIKFNDIGHIANDVKDIKTDMGKLTDKVDLHAERISKIEGKMNGG